MDKTISNSQPPEFLMDNAIVHFGMPVSKTPLKPLTFDDIQSKAVPEQFLNQPEPELLMDNANQPQKIVNFVMPISETPVKPLTIDSVLGKIKDSKASDSIHEDSHRNKIK